MSGYARLLFRDCDSDGTNKNAVIVFRSTLCLAKVVAVVGENAGEGGKGVGRLNDVSCTSVSGQNRICTGCFDFEGPSPGPGRQASLR
jgi:hypothetical protein